MIIGVPKEVKILEKRVGLTPASAGELVRRGHKVLIENGAGIGIGSDNRSYQSVGAEIIDGAKPIFDQAEMIVKVKEPQAQERAMLREDQTLFTYLHLAPDPDQTKDLIDSGVTAIAYETVTDNMGGLPLLAPMSKVAGRMAVQAGAHVLESPQGGSGILIGGIPGVSPAEVVVIGGGVVGENSIEIAVGMGASVTVLDRDNAVLDRLSKRFGSSLKTLYPTTASLHQAVLNADLVIGAVLVAGAAAPKLINAQMVKEMKSGSVIVDVAIDQGGCCETSKATTHAEPTYVVDQVVHYCVANMPGAVANTSTYGLNNATLPFIISLADNGAKEAMAADPHLLAGLNVARGQITDQAVAEAHNVEYKPAKEMLDEL